MYTALAEVYDLFYEDDAEARAAYYLRELPTGEGVDIGCGTGALTRALYRSGRKVYGVDASEAMLRRAAQAALREGLDIRFVRGDIRTLAVLHPLRFAVAALDVVNYIADPRLAFARVASALERGGMFAFDVSSEYKIRRILAGNTFSQTKNDVTYLWQNSMRGKRLTIDFTVFSPAGEAYIKTCETQTQYAHTEEELRVALAAAGFGDIRAYAFGTRRAPREKTERIAFFAVKQASSK